jgi:hypothetical protein
MTVNDDDECINKNATKPTGKSTRGPRPPKVPPISAAAPANVKVGIGAAKPGPAGNAAGGRADGTDRVPARADGSDFQTAQADSCIDPFDGMSPFPQGSIQNATLSFLVKLFLGLSYVENAGIAISTVCINTLHKAICCFEAAAQLNGKTDTAAVAKRQSLQKAAFRDWEIFLFLIGRIIQMVQRKGYFADLIMLLLLGKKRHLDIDDDRLVEEMERCIKSTSPAA